MHDPVTIPIKHMKALWFGVFNIVLSLLAWWIVFVVVLNGAGFSFGLFSAICIGSIFVFLGVWFIGLSLKRPVAFRMDRHGISGFYTEPLTWNEISKIEAVAGAKGHRSLGFRVHDPMALRARQTPWRRFVSWDAGFSTGTQILIPETLLHGVRVADLMTQAKAFHAQATAGTT